MKLNANTKESMGLLHHHHDHSCSHEQNYNRSFALGVLLNVVYIVIEAVYGLSTGSLALLADAGHNLSDVLGLLIAWAAFYFSRLKPTQRYTYGWGSTTILAALTNALLLMVALGGILWEAISRIGQPQDLPGMTIIVVAAIGVVINTLTALLFLRGRHDDLNLKGAFLHMAADAGVSAGVVLAGLSIYLWGWNWIDPIISIAIVLVIFIGTWGLLKDSLNLALQAVPKEIDPAAVLAHLESLPGVNHVHDLHIWAMSTTETALSVHLVLDDLGNLNETLARAHHDLNEQFQIEHNTIQIEQADFYECHSDCGRS